MAVTAAILGAVGIAGCGAQSVAGTGSGKVQVVSAENFWGSIAAQLGGQRVNVQSIIVNPTTDPHSYEPTVRDARTMATAQMAIVNGIGYDNWASRLLAADSAGGPAVLNVGTVVGLSEGDNPHQWYSPRSVRRVIAQVVADYDRLDPAGAPYYARQEQAFESRGLARYDELRREIRARYAGTPVGYSESIFQPLGEDLGLKLATPYSFAKAIAEGTDVSAEDKETVDSQARNRRIAVWVFNGQNVTPDVQRVNEIASARHIPVVTVTETLSPASESFQQWQVAQLEELAQALHEAAGR